MAGASVLFQYDDHELRDLVKRTGDRIRNVLPVMKSFGEYMTLATEDRFKRKEAPDGSGWKALSPVTRALKKERGYDPDKILVQEGWLKNIHPEPDKTGLTIASDRKYAAIHQYGGMAGRNRKVEIPQREFLGFSAADVAELTDTVKDWLMLGVP